MSDQRPTIRTTTGPNSGRYGREQLPGRTEQQVAASPRVRVSGGRAATPRQIDPTPVDEEPVRPGRGPEFGADELESLAFAELRRLREVFNRPSGGQWAVLYDPFRRRWIAVKGKSGWQCAGTPAALEKLIDRA